MHKLLEDAPGKTLLLLGNEAIARGAIEAGVACGATYPGTPSSEISLNLFQISRETDLYFEYSTNEKVALEVAAAAANCGVRTLCIMKHVGVNVAADALMTLAYVGIKGGLVIVSADDPYMFSSQNEQDNRYYGKLSGLCILEPSTLQEAKEMTVAAFDLSEKLGQPVILRTTTRINHSTAAITLGPISPRQAGGGFEKNPFMLVTVPAVSRKLHTRLLERIEKAVALAEQSPYNFVQGQGPLGIVTNGVSFNYVADAVNDLKLNGRVSILRLGFTNPAPKNLIASFLAGKERVLVAEEGEPFMEEMVKVAAQEKGFALPIAGKGKELFSHEGEFDPALVRRVIAAYFSVLYQEPEKLELSDLPPIPARPPNLCAGCPHRASFAIIKKAAKGKEVMFPTDIGCYTLGLLPPLNAADFLICMGSSSGTAGGFARFSGKQVISFIGDSTFFHSGIPGLVNAIYNNHDFTLVILDNGTTAMTGHQPHPGVDMEALGFGGYNRIDIEKVIRGLGVENIAVIEPLKVKKSIKAVEELFQKPGVKVVLSKELCPLYARSLGKASNRVFAVSDKCKNHRICVDELGCPAMYIQDGRVKINPGQCTGCAVCAQVCPENAILPAK
jgi:indolepyruvate ferredoxin oxidoreductase alpha subunit